MGASKILLSSALLWSGVSGDAPRRRVGPETAGVTYVWIAWLEVAFI